MSYKKSTRRGLLIAEILFCYMLALAVISHVRGPEKYEEDTKNTRWTAESFLCVDDTGLSGVRGNTLHVQNDVPGRNIEFRTGVQLAENMGFQISFYIDCPADFAGDGIAVDLYSDESGYDWPYQIYIHTLSAGVNEVSCSLFPGEGAPDNAWLRIFTSSKADYDIQDLQVCRLIQAEKVSVGLKAALGVGLLATVITGAAGWRRKKMTSN